MSSAVCTLPPVYILGDLVSAGNEARTWRRLLPRLAERGLRFEARRFWCHGDAAQEVDARELAALEAMSVRRVPRGSPVLTMDPDLAVHARSLVPEAGPLLVLDARRIGAEAVAIDAFVDRLCVRLGEISHTELGIAEVTRDGDHGLRGATDGTQRAIKLIAPVLGTSGYASDGRALFLALEEDPRVHVRLEPLRFGQSVCEEDRDFLHLVLEANARRLEDDSYDAVHVLFPPQFRPDPKARRNILRTMYETDSVPRSWHDGLRRADEIWVPSAFHLRSFRKVVPEDRIRIVPELLDPLFTRAQNTQRRESHDPLAAAPRATRFLSIFDWSTRKNPELLLRSFGESFRHGEAELVLKVSSSRGESGEALRERTHRLVREAAHAAGHDAPHVDVLDQALAVHAMPGLYEAADAFVLATRGEGWCRPVHEAMACGLPVIASAFGGIQDLIGTPGVALPIAGRVLPVAAESIQENPALLPVDGREQRWFEASSQDLSRRMRWVHEHRLEAGSVGENARDYVDRHFSRLPPLDSPTAPVSTARSRSRRRLSIALEGPVLGHSSYARIARALTQELAHDDALDLRLVESSASPIPNASTAEIDEMLPTPVRTRIQAASGARSDVCIRSSWPVSARPPNASRWIQRVDWEYGALPEELATILTHGPDEIWVHSRHVEETVVAAGIARDRIHVVPHGIDPDVYCPQGPQLEELRSWIDDRCAFLFIGPTIPRKGFDLLLLAWMQAFTNSDRACLILKTSDRQCEYEGQGCTEVLSRVRAHPACAEIRVLEDDLSDQAMPQLYRSADCLVHPYRGEGFGMTVLEARACGRITISTSGGACDDFLDGEACLRVPSKRVPVALETPCVGQAWLLESDVDALAAAMRLVVDQRRSLGRIARADSVHVRKSFSWARTAQRTRARLLATGYGRT